MMQNLRFFFLAIGLTTLLFGCNGSGNKAGESDPVVNDPAVSKSIKIIRHTLKAMSGELRRAVRRGGVQEAVPYCNANAMPITQQMATKYNAKVRRISLKYRNEKNAPTPAEKRIMKQYAQDLAAGKKLKFKVTELPDGNTMFNSAIQIRSTCLKCHGTVGTDISETDYQLIKSLYPNDKAVGYKVAELRGMWSIVFGKQ